MVFKRAKAGLLRLKVRGYEAGQSLVEYGLIIALIAVAAIGVLSLASGSVFSMWSFIQDEVVAAVEAVLA